MKNIHYIEGVLTQIQPIGRHIVVSICNEVGIWSGANAKDIAKRWPQARTAYLNWYRHRIRNDFALGAVQFLRAHQPVRNQKSVIANLVAQSEVSRPIRYLPFEKGLIRIGQKALKIGATIHLPSPTMDQSDSWPDLEDIIIRVLSSSQIGVFVYCRSSDKGPKPAANVAMNFRLRPCRKLR